MNERLTILQGDCRETLRTLPAGSVQCCVTSPPYWKLRDYGAQPRQIGLEETPEAFVAELVGVFAEVWRVLKDDGTLWLNLGDSYCGARGGFQGESGQRYGRTFTADMAGKKGGEGLKPKDLIGIPWRVAFALQSAGWYLRSDIIWHKPNPMPESVTDRPTKSHEYIFLLTKSERYYYDAEAIKEPVSSNANQRVSNAAARRIQSGRDNGICVTGSNSEGAGINPKSRGKEFNVASNSSLKRALSLLVETRNKRTVWTVQSQAYSGAHFATYPPDLIKPCIMAGSRPGDTVLDPFGGSGTTAQVAIELGRRAILCELNPEYWPLIDERTAITPGLAF